MDIICFHNPDEDNGYLSNWYLSSFTVDGVAFSSMEQFMMYRKAICFGDEAVAAQILSTSDVAKIKSLGRQVSNYDESMWNGIRQIVVYEGLLAKFSQNEELKGKLKATENAVLAECAVKDRIWGIGLSMKDPDRLNKAKWNGQNLLGYALMMVRERLQQDYSWEQRKFGEVGETYTGLSGKSKDDFGHGSGKFITYMNIFSNPVASPNMTESIEIDDSQNKVRFGDVLFTTSSETPDEVGMSSVWLENAENTYLNSFCFGYRPTAEFNPYYLAYMLRSSSMRKKITFLAQGISRYNISKNKMMDIEMPIPSIDEQKQIGEYFANLDRLITLHQRELYKHLRYRILKVRRKSYDF